MLSTSGLKFFYRNQVGTVAGIPCEFHHAHATVEFCDGNNYGFMSCLCLRESNGILKLAIRKINSQLHIPRIVDFGVKSEPDAPRSARR